MGDPLKATGGGNDERRPPRIVQVLPSMRRAGAESVVASLCRGLAAAGIDTHLLVIGNRFDYRSDLADSGVHIHFLNLFQGPIRFYRRDRVWWMRRRLAAFFRALRADIAHFHLYHGLVWGGVAAHRAGARVFYTVHGQNPFAIGTDWSARWLRWGFRRAVTGSHCRLLAVSGEAARHLASGLGWDVADIDIQPNPVELHRWRFNPATDVPRRAILVGTLYPLKRVDVAIRALTEGIDDAFELWLVGDGPERQRLQSLARTANVADRVSFLGMRRDLPELMPRAGVAWLLSEREGLPMVALEAMAAGIPLVASDVPGTRDLVRDGQNGLLVPLDDPRAVMRTSERLWREPALRRRLIEGGRHTAEAHGLAAIVDQHLARYRRALRE